MKKSILTVTALTFLIAGCQSNQPMKQSAVDNSSFMGLWNTYSNCQNTNDLDQLKQSAIMLRTAAKRSLTSDSFVLPLPGKLQRFIAAPSPRLAVDIKAMSASCSLRAGQAAVQARQTDIAKELLHGILDYYPEADYSFYSVQAKAILSELEPADFQVSLHTR